MSEHRHPEHIAAAICAGAGEPQIWWGSPGIGKNAYLYELCKAYDAHLELILLSTREPADVAGMPALAADGTRANFIPPSWTFRLCEHTQSMGVLAFDELSCAPPANQAAALRIVQEMIVGEKSLPSGTVRIMMANPSGQAAGGWDLAPPMANRLCHFNWHGPTSDEFADAMITGVWAKPDITTLPKDWRDTPAAQRARSLVGAYHKVRKVPLSNVPADLALAGKAWPSPRSWTMATNLLAAAASAGYDERSDVAVLLVGGCIGDAAALELVTWLRAQDLQDPEAILKDPSIYKHGARQDLVWATLSSVVGAVCQKNTAARWEAAWSVLIYAANAGAADIAAAAGRPLARNRPVGAKDPKGLGEAMGALFKAAGLIGGGK